MSQSNTAALILVQPQLSHLVAAGLPLTERWKRGLKAAGFASEEVAPEALASALLAQSPNLLVADGSCIFEQAALEPFRDTVCADSEALILTDPRHPGTPAIRMGATVAAALGKQSPQSFDALMTRLEALQASGQVSLRRFTPENALWRRAATAKEASATSWEILKRLRLRPGGLAAQSVNRRISIPITRMILPFPISPNWMTTFTGFVGLAATAAMIQGGYVWAVIGAFLMQFSSILDGCDGEIARMKYQSSEFGGWYDSIWDEWVNALFLAGVGYNLSLSWNFPWFLWMGVFAGGVSITYAFFQWHSKAKHGIGLYWWWDQGKPKKVIWESKSLISYIKKIFWRDSFLLVYFIATVLWYPLPVVLAISTGGTIGVFCLLFVHIFIKRARW